MGKPATTYVVTFTTMTGSDGIRGLRRTLKTALRRDGLKCVDVRELAAPNAKKAAPPKPRNGPGDAMDDDVLM